MRVILNILYITACLVIINTSALAQTTFFVSPKGKNTNPGTIAKPFAGIDHAKLKARKIPGPVVIYLLEGVYHLKQPVVFTAEDARKQKGTLSIKNFNNQKVTVSGAVALQLKWKKYKNRIWQAEVIPDVLFDELFVNGKLQRMARYPNYEAAARYLGGTSANAISKERAAYWQSPAGGYVHALHGSMWGDFHYIITGKNDKGELTLEGGWQNNRRMGMHETHRFVENVFEELDTVNEWYYDKKTKTLYYYPPAGLDLTTATIETPQIAHLFEFKGSEKAPVTNINIEGLTLTQTLRTFMENKEPLLRSDWTIYRGGAVLYEGAVNCTLKNCTLTNLGGNAIFFNKYNRNCTVSGCLISN
ncbi:MAG: peptide-binding protein, partial [Lacibacter sp.]